MELFEFVPASLPPFQLLELLKVNATAERFSKIRSVVEGRTFNVAPVLENIYDRGNISAVMRSAEAFGFVNFHIIEQADAKFKNANRVSQGTEKWLEISKHRSVENCLKSLRNFQIVGTDLNATDSIGDIDWGQPTAIFFGNEKDGISDEVKNACDYRIVIPMHGFAQSFNISVAGALAFQYIHLQRLALFGAGGDLTQEQKIKLGCEYLYRSMKNGHQRVQQLIISWQDQISRDNK